jgi:hypothetical protein
MVYGWIEVIWDPRVVLKMTEEDKDENLKVNIRDNFEKQGTLSASLKASKR